MTLTQAPETGADPGYPHRDRRAGGRTRITSRALNRVVSAVSAEALGVEAGRVGVELADENGGLVLTVRSPIRVVGLSMVTRHPAVVGTTGGTILERAARAQGIIRSRVVELTGYDIARVVVRLDSVDIRPERRVR